MSFLADESPIIACSTGNSTNTAVALIRLSGFKNLHSLQAFFSFNLKKIKPRFSHLTQIKNESEVFDQALMVFFPEGASYTGENVLELSVHGNQLNIDRILKLFISTGDFRIAAPGEFSYRALKNKKLTLSQVEGLDMLLNANSNLMLSQGLDILQGELHQKYHLLHELFIKAKSALELSIDFSEDVGEEESRQLFSHSFQSFYKILCELHSRTEGNNSSLLSPEVVLVGQTNAGKSSLFNLLFNQNRSIVSNIAGTTRDYVTEYVSIGGNTFKLIDTAGIRESSDQIEQIGIGRSLDLLERSFFKILIVNPLETSADYFKKFNGIEFDLLLFSHCDHDQFLHAISQLDLSSIGTRSYLAANFLTGSIEPLILFSSRPGPMGPKLFTGSIEPLSNSGPIEPAVKQAILSKFRELSAKNPILLNRHRTLINKIHFESTVFMNNFKDIDDVAILSSEFNLLGTKLADLIGIVSADDVLNSIFANFCIGK